MVKMSQWLILLMIAQNMLMATSYKLRHIQERVRFLSQHHKVILLTGAQYTGKTTLLRNLFPNISVITLDKLRDRYNAKADPYLFIKKQTLDTKPS